MRKQKLTRPHRSGDERERRFYLSTGRECGASAPMTAWIRPVSL